MASIRSEQGSAMLISLVVLLMMSLLGIAAIKSSDSDMTIAQNYKADLRSFYTAEAGAEMAYAILRDTVTWRTGFSFNPFKGGTYSVALLDSLTDSTLVDTVLVRSVGTRSDALSIIEVKLAPLEPFGWAAFADEYMKLCGGTSTDSYDSDSGSYAATQLDTLGDVGSNGHVKMCGTADINGIASTSSAGDLEVNGGAQFQDTTSTMAPLILDPVPQSDIDFAEANSLAPGGLTGTFNYNNGTKNLRINPGNTVTMASGVYYFNDWSIKGNLELEPGASVRIYLVGDATINAGGNLNTLGAPSDFLIFGVGDKFNIAGGAEIRAAMYMPDTEIKLAGGADLYGSFIGNFADDIGGSSFHFDRALKDLKLSSILTKVSWRER